MFGSFVVIARSADRLYDSFIMCSLLCRSWHARPALNVAVPQYVPMVRSFDDLCVKMWASKIFRIIDSGEGQSVCGSSVFSLTITILKLCTALFSPIQRSCTTKSKSCQRGYVKLRKYFAKYTPKHLICCTHYWQTPSQSFRMVVQNLAQASTPQNSTFHLRTRLILILS